MRLVRFKALIIIAALVVNLSYTAKANGKKKERPNFVVIMCDDVSHDMFGCYGNEEVKTPNIDKLAQEGVYFQTAWNSALCCPARAEIMTGKYATTTGFWNNGFAIPQEDGSNNLFEHHTAFSKILNDNGYRTAVAGKWHIGGAEHEFDPIVGFDEYCMWQGLKEVKILLNQDSWEGGWEATGKTARYWNPCVIQNGELIKTTPNDFGPDIYTGFICDFIDRSAKADEPFLAYYPMVAPHGPYVEVPTRTDAGSNDPQKESKVSNEQRFVELVDYIDILVGRILNQLEESGVAENTVVIFTSDNGTAVTAKSRGVERGCHIPFVVAGKGIKQRGLSTELCDATDILPTLVDFAKADAPKGFECDGESLMPFLTGKTDAHKDVIHSCIGTTQLLRTKSYLLEVICPVLGVPQGRFYYTGENHSGNNYTRAENVPEHEEVRQMFQNILDEKYVGLTKDHPYFLEKGGKKFLKLYTKAKPADKHLHNHKDYQKYDETITFDESTKWYENGD
ncbi:sulfatase-like hydrolase/transferase [Carboxylicivirga marina]|uniref:sulfatase-like hydrolase/transferase n=1 Tax=Carboxylicivirga marina TaxID=2800988 RepID=UPI0025954D77|nr:sulfatase-like hydrolase/transferase [uncultured Carboxylicivirga sp.]